MAKQVLFTDEFPLLPSNAPMKQPHIIDIESFRVANDPRGPAPVQIWDAIATMLLKVSQDTLMKFLDPKVKEFQMVRQSVSDSSLNIALWRKGNVVMVGVYEDLKEKKGDLPWLYKWDNLIHCKISNDGSWQILSSSHGKLTGRDLRDSWENNFVKYGKDNCNTSWISETKKEHAGLASILGTEILESVLHLDDTRFWNTNLSWKMWT